jgi:lipoprotein
MKLKYIFMFLGVMLLGLTACGKKDTPEPSNKNPFAGTKWERVLKATGEDGSSEIISTELQFIDDSRLVILSDYKDIAKDGSIIKQNPTVKEETTYTYEGLVATVIIHKIENDKQVTRKGILTMDAAKQKITVTAAKMEEGEEPEIYTRKK